jgi:nucleotide-binding universal stress UspA family protein
MKRILVAYDDTEPSRHALERAAQLAKAFDSEVLVTSVTPLLVGSPRSTGPVDRPTRRRSTRPS